MNYENETYINKKDIWLIYGARLIHDSYTNLLLPATRKEFVENDLRSQAGKQIFIDNPQPTSKEVQLTFLIEGDNLLDFLSKYKALVKEIEKGLIELKAIPIQTAYYLTMDSPMPLDVYGQDNKGILTIKFVEANPTEQKSTLKTAYCLSHLGKALSIKSKLATTKIEKI